MIGLGFNLYYNSSSVSVLNVHVILRYYTLHFFLTPWTFFEFRVRVLQTPPSVYTCFQCLIHNLICEFLSYDPKECLGLGLWFVRYLSATRNVERG